MARILLVDDDPALTRAVQKLLGLDGHHCITAQSAAGARRSLADGDFDLLLLDVNLPDGDGLTLCRQLRTRHTLPILLLTARSSGTDKVVGLEIGADDYITKPFDPAELVARVRAHLRRSREYSSATPPPRRISLGDVVLDVEAREVHRDGTALPLTQREFDLLHLLARHRDKALASDWIFEHVWGYDAALGTKNLAVCVQRVRRKIEADPARPALLRTVRGFGYKLVSAPETEEV